MSDTSTSLPLAELVHQLPGRLRLRVDSRRGDAAFFAGVAKRVAEIAGVRAIRANPRTGSLLIEYDGTAEALARSAREHGLLRIASPAPPSARTAMRSRRFAPVRPLSVAAVGLAGLGLYQAARGRLLGSATENFWNAYGAYAQMNRKRIAATLAAFGLYQVTTGRVLGSAASLLFYALSAHNMARGRDGAT
jgi:hypothetical protein